MPVEQGKPRRSTAFKVVFPTMPTLEHKPAYISIHQSQYSHDVLTLEFIRTSEEWFTQIPTGLPVQVTWRQGTRQREFVGYVSYTSKTVQGEIKKPMSIVCVGASYPLKERVTRTFSNLTIPSIAGIIAREHGLNLIADSHPTIFPQLTIAGHSYWEWLVEQARKIGFAMYMDGVNLYFQRFDKMINRFGTDSPLLFFDMTYAPPYSRGMDRTLHEFKVLKGDHIETAPSLRTNKTVAGVDPISGATTVARKSPGETGLNVRGALSDVLFQEHRSDQVVQSQSIARELAEGAANLGRFNLPAKIKCIGDPRIKPFAPVRIAGTGVETDGLWVVQEATHILKSNGEYEIEAVILTDGTGANFRTPLRPDINAEEGTVNIVAALNTSSNSGAAWGAVVTTGVTPIRSKDEGFNKSNSRWRASGVKHGLHS